MIRNWYIMSTKTENGIHYKAISNNEIDNSLPKEVDLGVKSNYSEALAELSQFIIDHNNYSDWI